MKYQFALDMENKLKILIVDDETEIVKLLTRLLKRNGYDVSSAHNLQDSRKLIHDEQPSIVFLDINLPDGNGLQELPTIKDNWPDTNVIVMSAYDTHQEKATAVKNGAYSFLTKPFTTNSVLQLLHSLEKSA